MMQKCDPAAFVCSAWLPIMHSRHLSCEGSGVAARSIEPRKSSGRYMLLQEHLSA